MVDESSPFYSVELPAVQERFVFPFAEALTQWVENERTAWSSILNIDAAKLPPQIQSHFNNVRRQLASLHENRGSLCIAAQCG